jgi:hypothetical protein
MLVILIEFVTPKHGINQTVLMMDGVQLAVK